MKRGLFHFSLTVPGWAAWKRWVCYVLQTDSDQTNTLFHNWLENEAMWLSISILASLGVSWLIRGSLEWPDWVRPAGPGRLQWQPVVLGPPLPPWLLHGEILPPPQLSNVIAVSLHLHFNSPQTIVDPLLIRSVRVMFSLSDDPRSELWCENSEPEPESPASPGWCRLSLLSLRHTAIPSNSWHYLSPLWVRLSTIKHKR